MRATRPECFWLGSSCISSPSLGVTILAEGVGYATMQNVLTGVLSQPSFLVLVFF